MNIISELATLFKPTFFLTSFIIGVFVIGYLSNLLIKKNPKGKLLIYPGAVLAVILLLYPYFYLSYPSDTFLYILKALISVPLIFFIPGYVAYNALVKEKLNLDFSEVVFLQILTSILISGWIGLTLAELGYFSLFNLLFLLVAFSVILAVKFKVKFRLDLFPKPELNYKSIALVVILLIAVALFFHPFEWIAGGGDPGIYVNTGVNIAKTGSIVIYDDPTFADIPNEIVSDFYRSTLKSSPFAGFYYDRFTGVIFPQFYHLFPVWIATLYSIFGLINSLYITPLFGVLGIISVYLAGKRYFNDNVGLIASALLCISLPQIWYSRYPTTEVMTQFLIFSGLFTFVAFQRTSNPFIGVLSGICFGESLLTRIDCVLILLPIILFFGYLRFTDKLKRHHFYFIVPFTLLSIYAFIHAVTVSGWYTFGTIRGITGMRVNYLLELIHEIGEYKVISCVILSITIFILMDIYSQKIMSKISKFSIHGKYVQYCFSIAIALLFIYFSFIRPLCISKAITYGALNLGMSYDELNLVRLSWYISSPGILLGVVGYILLLYRKPYKETYLFLIFALLFTTIFIYKSMIMPPLHWWARRYVPVILPSFMIAIGYTLDKIKDIKYGKLAAIILLCVLIGHSMNIGAPVINHIEFEGFIDQTDSLAKHYNKDDVLIFDGGISGNILPVPLKYIYEKNTINLRHADPRLHQDYVDYDLLESMISIWNNNGKTVFMANPQENTAYALNYTFVLTQKITMEFPLMEQTYLSLPSKIHSVTVPVIFYKVEPTKKFDIGGILDIGSNDLGYIKDFHATESKGNTTFRWTKDVSYVKIPISESDAPLSLQLRINGWRPINVSPANVSLVVNSHLLTNFTVERAWKTYSFTIPKEFLTKEPLVIEIHSETFVPCKYMDSSDQRDIGVMVDWVKLEKITK